MGRLNKMYPYDGTDTQLEEYCYLMTNYPFNEIRENANIAM